MNQKNVIIIPITPSQRPDRYMGTPVKVHVVGYARVVKGIGAGVQIRKNIRCIIGCLAGLGIDLWNISEVELIGITC